MEDQTDILQALKQLSKSNNQLFQQRERERSQGELEKFLKAGPGGAWLKNDDKSKPIEIPDNAISVKLLLLEELGMLDPLKNRLNEANQVTDRKISQLLGEILQLNSESIRPYLSFIGNVTAHKNNPLNSKSKVSFDEILKRFGLSRINIKDLK